MIAPYRSTPKVARWLAQAAARLTAGLAAALSALLAPVTVLAIQIVDTTDVAAALARSALVSNTHDAKACAERHLPSAVTAGDVVTVVHGPNREDWLLTAQVQAILARAGIDPLNREVIADGRTGDTFADRVQSGLRHVGAKVSQDDHGGCDAWQAAGRVLSQAPATLLPLTLTLKLAQGERIDTGETLARLKSGQSQRIDTPSGNECLGDHVSAIRGGHLPGAANLPYEANWIDPTTLAELAARPVTTRAGVGLTSADVRQQLDAGLDRNKAVVMYSQRRVRTAVTAGVPRDLGCKDVTLPEPGWLGYAAQRHAPVEREVFVNLGAPDGRIAAPQGTAR